MKVLKVLVQESSPVKLYKQLSAELYIHAWMRFGRLEAFNSVNIVCLENIEKSNS